MLERPVPPALPKNDADRPRWVREDMAYKVALSRYWADADFRDRYPELVALRARMQKENHADTK